MSFRFFKEHDIVVFFNQICQIVSGVFDRNVPLKDQLQITLNIIGNKIFSILCFDRPCTYQYRGPNEKKLATHLISLLTSQLKNCISHKDSAVSTDHSAILCKHSFNYSAFINGLVGGFIVCTCIYFAMYYDKKFTLRQLRARNNIYTERRKPLVKFVPETSNERVEILPENAEENKEEPIYEDVSTTINIETCRPITVVHNAR
ncbi:hypothetical protein K6025_05275 [Ehrlichia sp. JZT12]